MGGSASQEGLRGHSPVDVAAISRIDFPSRTGTVVRDITIHVCGDCVAFVSSDVSSLLRLLLPTFQDESWRAAIRCH